MGSKTSKSNQPQSYRPKMQVPKYDLTKFGVITVLFNPIKYKSRYELYHKFDEHMTRSGVTLLTVECIFDVDSELGLPMQKFEVTRPNDPRHMQIRAPSIIWMKENLINIAVKRLPAHVEYVAWLDADIEFERLDWPHHTIDQLQHYPIVQLFEIASFLGPRGKKDILRQDFSFGYSIRHRRRIEFRDTENYACPGYAWAMRRSAFEAMGGLLDFSIIGAGDLHFASAILNRIQETIPEDIHDDYRRLAQAWSEQVSELSGNGAFVGYIPVNLWHHWHGSRIDRGYTKRWSLISQRLFSPLRDLEKNDRSGLIRLARSNSFDRSQPRKNHRQVLEKNLVDYFRSRNEDNIKKQIRTIDTTVLTSKPLPTNNESLITPTPGFHSLQPLNSTGTYPDESELYQLHCTCPGPEHRDTNYNCPFSRNDVNDDPFDLPETFNPSLSYHMNDYDIDERFSSQAIYC